MVRVPLSFRDQDTSFVEFQESAALQSPEADRGCTSASKTGSVSSTRISGSSAGSSEGRVSASGGRVSSGAKVSSAVASGARVSSVASVSTGTSGSGAVSSAKAWAGSRERTITKLSTNANNRLIIVVFLLGFFIHFIIAHFPEIATAVGCRETSKNPGEQPFPEISEQFG